MKVHAIGDLHLSGSLSKDMDVFGREWENHAARIKSNWFNTVDDCDVVLIPGDISWATHLEDAVPDLEWISELPGTKLLVRGNHDYWWVSPAKVRRALPARMHIIQNDAINIGGTVFCGSRGWVFPTGGPFSQEDQKIFEREKIRLRLSLEAAKALGGERIVVMMHYPPLYNSFPRTGFTDIIEEYTPAKVVFGHLHGRILEQIDLDSFKQNGIEYKLVSADYIGFKPVLIDAD